MGVGHLSEVSIDVVEGAEERRNFFCEKNDVEARHFTRVRSETRGRENRFSRIWRERREGGRGSGCARTCVAREDSQSEVGSEILGSRASGAGVALVSARAFRAARLEIRPE